MEPLKLLFCGTHPVQTNGYSKVVYELAKSMSESGVADGRVQVSIYGFQRTASVTAPSDDRELPYVSVYDAQANEKTACGGFGVNEIKKFVEASRPDVVVVFNDVHVMCTLIDQLKDANCRKGFKLIAYVDQVYMSQRKEFVKFINSHADAAIAFTPYWETNLRKIGITIPTFNLRHGFNPMSMYPLPRHVARKYLGLPDTDFIVLNLNRNQPRKRWDKCMQVMAEVLARCPGSNIKLLVATDMTGAFDLKEVFERELGKWGISLETGMRHIVTLTSPQRLSDLDINALYNATDVGINTCDGEGFGLCNFEHAAVGVPQVVPALGGFLDYFDSTCATMIEPCTTFYVDGSRDIVGGEAQLCDQKGFVDGIVAYHADPVMRAEHGRRARRKILDAYGWENVAGKLCDIVETVCGGGRKLPEEQQVLPRRAASSNPLDLSSEEVFALIARIGI